VLAQVLHEWMKEVQGRAVLNGALKLLEVGQGTEFGNIVETEGKSLKI
jgi:hypothetical protein